LYRRKVNVDEIIGHDLGVTLCGISREINRQVGLLIDQRGKVAHVIVGTPGEIVIPDLSRTRSGGGRLKGLRLVHTHLKNEPLSRDDLTDLAMLRLDLVAAIGVGLQGQAESIYVAHINPAKDAAPVWTELDPVPFSRLEIPFREFIQGLESELARHDPRDSQGEGSRAILIHISTLPRKDAAERLAELAELARTERIACVDRMIYRGKTHPSSLVGSNRMKDLIIHCMSSNIDLLLFDQELSPAQSRWIGGLTEMAVMDRTQLILRIFARRAFSRDGKLRVELARLRYLLPRIGSRDDAMSRIRGGIGVRGPGETSMEVSRRRIKERIQVIRERLERLSQGRKQRRSLRNRSGVPQVAIVGYTNAGKSTLLNALTNSDVLVEDKLFATLDPASRRIRFPGNMEMVISDTVGFIRDLPEGLMEAFRSTLEELSDADYLLHLVDISSGEFAAKLATVEKTLVTLGLDRIPRKIVFNKIDLADPGIVANEATRHDAIAVSAVNRAGLDALMTEISDHFGGTGVRKGKGRWPEHEQAAPINPGSNNP